MDASLSARQFVLLNPDRADAVEFSRLADKNMKRYQKHLPRKIRGNAIAGSLIGGMSWFLTASSCAADGLRIGKSPRRGKTA